MIVDHFHVPLPVPVAVMCKEVTLVQVQCSQLSVSSSTIVSLVPVLRHPHSQQMDRCHAHPLSVKPSLSIILPSLVLLLRWLGWYESCHAQIHLDSAQFP